MMPINSPSIEMGAQTWRRSNVAEVRGGVAPEGGRVGLGHVLPHDVARAEAAHEHGSLVANHRAKPVVVAQREGGCAGAAFLA